jgi:hypothetical protein
LDLAFDRRDRCRGIWPWHSPKLVAEGQTQPDPVRKGKTNRRTPLHPSLPQRCDETFGVLHGSSLAA